MDITVAYPGTERLIISGNTDATASLNEKAPCADRGSANNWSRNCAEG